MDLPAVHARCAEIFKRILFESEVDGSQSVSNACKVYDALVGDCFERQDCIGENFNQLLHQIVDEWFGHYRPGHHVAYYLCTYVLLLNLCVERVDQIFEVIDKGGKTKIFQDYRRKTFPTLRRIRRWANFFKHPKEFLFTHWPQYRDANEVQETITPTVVIDDDFVAKYYANGDSRPSELQNNPGVVVAVPDLVEITTGFCAEMNTFFQFICRNDLVADYLRQRSTIDSIYEAGEADPPPNPPASR